METINETRTATNSDRVFVTLVFIFLIFCAFITNNESTRNICLIFMAFIIFGLALKRTLRLTVDGDNITIEKNIAILIPKIKKIELNSNEIQRCVITYRGGRYGHSYNIEIHNKKREVLRLKYFDRSNMAKAIKILFNVLLQKHIVVEFATSIYEEEAEDLKLLIEKKYNLQPNKFNPWLRFDGRKYI